MEELKDRLNRMEAELCAVRAESTAMRKETTGMRRQNAMLRLAMVAAVAVWFLVGPAASPKTPAVPDVIRAKKLEIVDDKGHVRGRFAYSDHKTEGNPATQLSLSDGNGRERFYVDVVDGVGAFVAVRDEKGNMRAQLWADPGGSGLTLHDENARERARLVASAEGPFLRLFEKNGVTIIWQAPTGWVIPPVAPGR